MGSAPSAGAPVLGAATPGLGERCIAYRSVAVFPAALYCELQYFVGKTFFTHLPGAAVQERPRRDFS